MKILAVVLCYNSAEYIAKCLTSLEGVETIVVDNASTDNSVELLKKDFSHLKLICNDQNLGYAGGNNIGINYALTHQADFVWIVNPDVRVAKSACKELLAAAQKYTDGAIFGSKCYFEQGFEFHKTRYQKKDLGRVLWYAGGINDWENVYAVHLGVDEVDHGQFDQLKPVDFATGASMFIRCSVVQKIGSLDERYFLYYEENDLCQRARRVGGKVYYVPTSQVWHANAQATIAGSSLVDYYTTRNRLLFGMRWAPIRTKIALVKESLRLVVQGRPWQKRGVMDFYLGNLGRGSYA